LFFLSDLKILEENVMRLTIQHLFETPEHIPTVAKWIHHEWWTDKPGHSEKTMENRLRRAKSADRIPLSFLAIDDDIPVGTINLVENDNETRPELYPWLAALLVQKKYRLRGIGSQLVHCLLFHARRLGIEEIYLGTDIPDFYKQFGAEIHEIFEDDFYIMRIGISE
jgi:predicted N-acetyltransferase YhbS